MFPTTVPIGTDSLEHFDSPNIALVSTLRLSNMLEAPLHCSTMNSSSPSLPPFLAPLVTVKEEDVFDEKDFWTKQVNGSKVLEELQNNLTNFNLLNDDIEECSTVYDETKIFSKNFVKVSSKTCDETEIFSKSQFEDKGLFFDASDDDLTEPFEKWEAADKKLDDDFVEAAEDDEKTVLFVSESDEVTSDLEVTCDLAKLLMKGNKHEIEESTEVIPSKRPRITIAISWEYVCYTEEKKKNINLK